MWSPDRRALMLLPLALAACGFRPAFAPGAGGSAIAGRTSVAHGTSELGFSFATALEDRLGPPLTDPAPFRLSYSLALDTERVAVTTAQTTNRFNLIGEANWRLGAGETGDALANGRAASFASYSATGTTLATRAARRNAITRLGAILADQVIADLASRPGLGR